MGVGKWATAGNVAQRQRSSLCQGLVFKSQHVKIIKKVGKHEKQRKKEKRERKGQGRERTGGRRDGVKGGEREERRRQRNPLHTVMGIENTACCLLQDPGTPPLCAHLKKDLDSHSRQHDSQ